MSASLQEIQQIELLARVDDLVGRVRSWTQSAPGWGPFDQCRAVLQRTLTRVETLRIRLESPLVVATFGGTGTGKSTLVNALVGEEVTTAGKERPTTRQPILICHPGTDLSLLGLPLDHVRIIQRDAELLRDIVLIDCPDPDTNEAETAGSNLARLRELLPHCDVLIYTSTQQKYRSARIVDELAEAAAGCRLVFVQTRADLDEDIREDWQRHLRGSYEVPDLFFVDSLQALRTQQIGQRPKGEMGRLIHLLQTQLSAGERVRIRRANVIDLLQAALRLCRQITEQREKQVISLEQALTEQRVSLSRKMAERLQQDLLTGRHLWERRLLGAVTDSWGFSPFSSILRLYNGLGAWIASMSLYRARSTAQLALIGAVEGTRWLRNRRADLDAEQTLDRASILGLDDALLRESELVVEGFVQSAGLPRDLLNQRNLSALRSQAVQVEGEFLGDARGRVDGIIIELAQSNSRWYIRLWYELLFLSYLGFVLYRAGRNFFYESFLHREPLLTTDFYLPATIFFVLWSALLVMAFTRRLRRGLTRHVERLSRELVDIRLADGLFPHVEAACHSVHVHLAELDSLMVHTEELRRDFAQSPQLGAPRVRAADESRQVASPAT